MSDDDGNRRMKVPSTLNLRPVFNPTRVTQSAWWDCNRSSTIWERGWTYSDLSNNGEDEDDEEEEEEKKRRLSDRGRWFMLSSSRLALDPTHAGRTLSTALDVLKGQRRPTSP
jgi:hypothetical protein